ncbi:MAG: Rrf2 family transcriptional regulator [Bacteroidota bacterium]
MVLSKTVGYAIRALIYLVSYQEDNKPLGIKAISDKLEVPKPYLSKIMQELSRRDVINSVKGPNGGFLMNENTLQTNILRVVEILDGLSSFQSCILGLNKCSDANPCPIHDKLVIHRESFLETLRNKKIIDLRHEFQKHGKVLVN